MNVADEADLQRVAPAVEQPHGDVAAVGVGAEEELGVPRRPDRDTAERDDVRQLAVDQDLVGDVVGVGPGVRDVLGVDRRQQAQHDHQQEHPAEHQRDLVAAQSPPGERVRPDPVRRADSLGVGDRLAERVAERRSGVFGGGGRHRRHGGAGSSRSRPLAAATSCRTTSSRARTAGLHDDGTEVHLVGRELRNQLVAVGDDVRLLGQVLVKRLPLRSNRAELRSGDGVELLQRGLDLRDR